MKRRDFFKNIGWIGILSQLPRIKTPEAPWKPEPLPPGYNHHFYDTDFGHISSATAMAGSFSDTYTQQMIKSTRAMSRQIERNLFREI